MQTAHIEGEGLGCCDYQLAANLVSNQSLLCSLDKFIAREVCPVLGLFALDL